MADFSVTSCTFSRSIVAPEDTIDITMTIKNTSGNKITKAGLCLCFTNADMYAPVLAYIGERFGRKNGAYLYCFDLDAPGDDNRAFHSSDLRYIFETLDGSWRPYGARDHEAAAQMASYLANFARSGDPNGPGLPCWEKAKKGVLRIAPGGTEMGRTNYLKLTRNFIRRPDPKA